MISCYPFLVIESEEDYKTREYKKKDHCDENVCVWWEGWHYPVFHFGNKEFPQYYTITDNHYSYRKGYTPVDKEVIINHYLTKIMFYEDIIKECKRKLERVKGKTKSD